MIFDKEDYKAFDPELWEAVAKEEERQQNNIELLLKMSFLRLLWWLKEHF